MILKAVSGGIIGDTPDFNLKQLNSNEIYVFIAFPAAFTPVCGSELPKYSKVLERIKNEGIVPDGEVLNVYGISTDTPETIVEYTTPGKEKNGLPSIGYIDFPIISDPKCLLRDSYGAFATANETQHKTYGRFVLYYDHTGVCIIEHGHFYAARNPENIYHNIKNLYQLKKVGAGNCVPLEQ